MKRVSGYLLVLLGCIHVLLGVISGWPRVKAIFAYGVWNALGQQSQTFCMKNVPCLQMNVLGWFVSLGLMLILFGITCAWIESKLQRPVPALIAWLLLIISIVYVVLVPVSGFWAVIAVAVYMLICSKQTASSSHI